MLSVVPAIFQLVRPVNLLITFFSIIAAAVVAGAASGQVGAVLLAGATGAFVAAGANAVNDVFDLEIDRTNRPERPLPSGRLSPAAAMWVWAAMTVLGLLTSSFISGPAFAVASGAALLLYLYSRWLKSRPVGGNILVASMTGLAFLYGGIAVGAIERAIVPALFAFLANLAREVVKDIEDREGDRLAGARTLPLAYGLRSARVVTSGSLVLLVGTTLAAYLLSVYDLAFLAIVLVADLLLLYVCVGVWMSERPSHMRRLSNSLKVSMVIGLAAIYFGTPGA